MEEKVLEIKLPEDVKNRKGMVAVDSVTEKVHPERLGERLGGFYDKNGEWFPLSRVAKIYDPVGPKFY